MSKGSVSKQNADMAKHLKERGVRRTTLACAICHNSVRIENYQNHLRLCTGRG